VRRDRLHRRRMVGHHGMRDGRRSKVRGSVRACGEVGWSGTGVHRSSRDRRGHHMRSNRDRHGCSCAALSVCIRGYKCGRN
jgi:hypothetical protein